MFFKQIIEDKLSQEIINISSISGGDINMVYKLTTSEDTCVLKVNTTNSFPQMFEKEKKGLQSLAETSVKTPKVIQSFKESGYQFFIIEFIKEEAKRKNFWENFAIDLAKIHKAGNDTFGLDYDNYIGSLQQVNTPKNTWKTFFIENRIQPLIKHAIDIKLLKTDHLIEFESMFSRFDEILPKEKPSLVHGDLWSGNLMCGTGQKPVFIDPAIYFGNREMDIAMTQMFGGFHNSFIDHYNEIFPLEKNWEDRIEIYNLYPNLVHLILFGASYLRGIENVISKF